MSDEMWPAHLPAGAVRFAPTENLAGCTALSFEDPDGWMLILAPWIFGRR
jgi:hypothetical protein